MQLKKLVECINKLKPEYYMLVQCVINHVLQEIIDSESFYDNGPQDISTKELLDKITSKTNEQTAQMILTCVVEFCITNYYPYEGQSWNFIDYYLTNYKDHLTTKEQKYLAALNTSYMSIYKITSVSPNNFVVMEDQVESKALKLKVFDKYFSQKIQKGQHVAVRALLKPNKKNKLKEY